MPDLMHRRLALVVVLECPARHAGCEDAAAVVGVCRGGPCAARAPATATCRGRGAGGHAAVAEEELRRGGQRDGAAGPGAGAAEVGLEVDVQAGVAAGAEGGAHLLVAGVGGPVVADGEGGRVEAEGDSRGREGGVEDAELKGESAGESES